MVGRSRWAEKLNAAIIRRLAGRRNVVMAKKRRI